MAAESPYDVSSDALRTLMGKRKQEMVEALEEQGGITSLMEKLQTSSDGLDDEEEDLKRRRDVFGPNWVPAAKSKSFFAFMLSRASLIAEAGPTLHPEPSYGNKSCTNRMPRETRLHNSWQTRLQIAGLHGILPLKELS